MLRTQGPEEEALFIFLDADNCIYNQFYYSIFLNFIAVYGEMLKNFVHAQSSDPYLDKTNIYYILIQIYEMVSYKNGQVRKRFSRKMTDEFLDTYQLWKEHTLEDESIPLSSHAINEYLDYIYQLGPLGEELLDAILYTANQPFFEEIISRVTKNKYTTLVLCCASNRQSWHLDKLNCAINGGPSFFRTLFRIKHILNTKLLNENSPAYFILDPILTSDFWEGYADGENFNLGLLEGHVLKKHDPNLQEIKKHGDTFFDANKFTLIYGLAHYVRYHNHHRKITALYFDDSAAIHQNLMSKLDIYKDLLPRGLVLEFWQYDGVLPVKKQIKSNDIARFECGEIITIEGTGPVDDKYRDTVMTIVKECHKIVKQNTINNDEDDLPDIDSANQLDFDAFSRYRFDRTPEPNLSVPPLLFTEFQRKKLVLLTDYDGCLLNELFYLIFYMVINKYGTLLSEYERNIKLESEIPTIKYGMDGIISYVKGLIYYQDGYIYIDPESRMKVIAKLLKKQNIHEALENIKEDKLKEHLTRIVNQYTQLLNNLGPKGEALINTMIFVANQAYFYETLQRIEDEHFDDLLIAFGSSRQSDRLNKGNKGPSYFSAMLAIEEKFNKKLFKNESQVNCELIEVLMADFCNAMKAGSSLKRIIKERNNVLSGDPIIKQEHGEAAFDDTKFSLVYTMIHYIAGLYPKDLMTIAFFDDRIDIHKVLLQRFNEHIDLIPYNIILEFWPYNGNLPKKHTVRSSNIEAIDHDEIVVLQNVDGEIDYNLRENVLTILRECGYDEYNIRIDSANSLDFADFKAKRTTTLKSTSSIFSSTSTQVQLLHPHLRSHLLFSASNPLHQSASNNPVQRPEDTGVIFQNPTQPVVPEETGRTNSPR